MTKVRILFFLLSLAVIVIIGGLASMYANGYRFNEKELRFTPNGILVVNSDPNGAQILIDGELKSATNATFPMPPGTYLVELKKEGFILWQKDIQIKKEEVTQIDATLFPAAPSLSAITFNGALNPSLSPDYSKIAYAVVSTDETKSGLWVLETVNLPLGFSRDPRRITDGNLQNSFWGWSPDSREILLTTKTGLFLLNSNEFVSQNKLVNVSSQKAKIEASWQELSEAKKASQLMRLPIELKSILEVKSKDVIFSPDETKVMYTASGSAQIKDDLIPPLPGASTQKQVRSIKQGKKYIYDIKEDRNFEIANEDQQTYWLGTSRNILIPEKDKIVISEYDGTNRHSVYSGAYIAPNAFPVGASNKIIILTNLGSQNSPQNLYSITLR